MKGRAIFWTVAMAYTGFLLTGRGLRTFNSLSITEGPLGALTGFLLAIMFSLREKRRRRPLRAKSVERRLNLFEIDFKDERLGDRQPSANGTNVIPPGTKVPSSSVVPCPPRWSYCPAERGVLALRMPQFNSKGEMLTRPVPTSRGRRQPRTWRLCSNAVRRIPGCATQSIRWSHIRKSRNPNREFHPSSAALDVGFRISWPYIPIFPIHPRRRSCLRRRS
jgi:hypothetical protein